MNDLNNGECEHEFYEVPIRCDTPVRCAKCKIIIRDEKPKPPFKDALRGFTHCPMCGKPAKTLTVEEIERILEDEFGMVEGVNFEIGNREETITFEEVSKAIHSAMVRKGDEK